VVNEFSHLAAIFEPAVIKPSPQKSSSGFPRPWASKGQDGRMERLIAITMCTLCPVGAWAWVSSGGSTFALRTCWLQADVTASWRSASCPLRLQSVPLHRCAATPSESAVPDKQTKYERNLKERQLRGEEMTSTRDSVSAAPLPLDDWRRFVGEIDNEQATPVFVRTYEDGLAENSADHMRECNAKPWGDFRRIVQRKERDVCPGWLRPTDLDGIPSSDREKMVAMSDSMLISDEERQAIIAEAEAVAQWTKKFPHASADREALMPDRVNVEALPSTLAWYMS